MINKKFLAVVLTILLLCISIIGCSNASDDFITTTTTTTTTTTAQITTQNTTTEINKISTTIPSSTTEKATTSSTTTSTTKSVSSTTKSITNQTTKKAKITTTNSTTQTTQKVDVCYISIECSEINKNIKDLKSGHKKYVPNDGYILSDYEVEINENDSVYEILCKACEDNKINLNSTSTQYGKYIAGINNLDERDCGKFSGWLYYVNGEKPSFAVSKYVVNNGDKILFSYTCGE